MKPYVKGEGGIVYGPTISPRKITTCAGIGDFIWMAMKLVNQPEKFYFYLPDGMPQRGHQILDLLPQIVAGHEYRAGLSYRKINDGNIQEKKRKWAQIKETSFYLSANKHLEEGRRIEDFLPDLETSYALDYATTENDKHIAAWLLNYDRPYIGIYTSAYNNARQWNGWGAEPWFKLIRMLNKKNVCFVVIGADYDIGISQEIMKEMDTFGIDYVNTVGQPLSVVIEMMKRLSYFIGFPSGLSILNETLGKDGTMFYAPHIKGIMNAWANPDRIKSGAYKGCIFPTPEQIFDWLKLEYKIFDKV